MLADFHVAASKIEDKGKFILKVKEVAIPRTGWVRCRVEEPGPEDLSREEEITCLRKKDIVFFDNGLKRTDGDLNKERGLRRNSHVSEEETHCNLRQGPKKERKVI